GPISHTSQSAASATSAHCRRRKKRAMSLTAVSSMAAGSEQLEYGGRDHFTGHGLVALDRRSHFQQHVLVDHAAEARQAGEQFEVDLEPLRRRAQRRD